MAVDRVVLLLRVYCQPACRMCPPHLLRRKVALRNATTCALFYASSCRLNGSRCLHEWILPKTKTYREPTMPVREIHTIRDDATYTEHSTQSLTWLTLSTFSLIKYRCRCARGFHLHTTHKGQMYICVFIRTKRWNISSPNHAILFL